MGTEENGFGLRLAGVEVGMGDMLREGRKYIELERP